jgi:hypothetical protein
VVSSTPKRRNRSLSECKHSFILAIGSLSFGPDARFYTLLPPAPPIHGGSRTFVILPTSKHKALPHFVPAKNGKAPDELQAHTGMFSATTNDGYYDVGLQAALLIREAVQRSRGVVDTTVKDDQKERDADEGFTESKETQDKARAGVVPDREPIPAEDDEKGEE